MGHEYGRSVFSFVRGTRIHIRLRITSLLSTIIFSLIYMAFHFFGIAYVLHKMTGVQLSKATIMQFFVVSLLLLEKAAIFAVFAILGYTTAFSFFSFGPLAATFLNNEFFIYFFNQLSIITAVVIALQFRFLRAFTAMSTSKLMILLIVLHLVLAALTAGISVLPLGEWIKGACNPMNKWITIGIAIIVSSIIAANSILLFTEKSKLGRTYYVSEYDRVNENTYTKELEKESVVVPESVSTVTLDVEVVSEFTVKVGDMVQEGQELAVLKSEAADSQRSLWESEEEAYMAEESKLESIIAGLIRKIFCVIWS